MAALFRVCAQKTSAETVKCPIGKSAQSCAALNHVATFLWLYSLLEFQAGCSKRIAKSLAAQAMYEKIPDDWKMNSGGHGYRGNVS